MTFKGHHTSLVPTPHAPAPSAWTLGQAHGTAAAAQSARYSAATGAFRAAALPPGDDWTEWFICIEGGHLGVAPPQDQDTDWKGRGDACNEGEGWGRGWNRSARLSLPALGSLVPTVILTLIQTLSLITASPSIRLSLS